MSPAEFRAARKALGLRQCDLAEILGYSGQVHISRIENGQSVPPIVSLIIRAIMSFGLPSTWPDKGSG